MMRWLRPATWLATLGVVVASWTAPASAQVRPQPYLGLGYSDAPTLMFGFQFLKDSGGDEDALVDEGGLAFQAFAAGGFRDSFGKLSAQGGAGVLWPTDGDTPAYWGPTVLASLDPGGLGGGLRLAGLFGGGFLWLTAGAIHVEDSWAAHINLDVTTSFLCDVSNLCN